MSNWSQQHQHELDIDHHLTYEKNDREQQSLSQSFPFSNNSITTLSTIHENEVKSYSQQLRETNVTVNLVDCMQCYVRIPRCTIEEKNHCSKTNTQIEFDPQLEELQVESDRLYSTDTEIELDHLIQELREEQEKVSQNQTLLQEQEEEFYGEALDMEDFNPMETYIYIDPPWPDLLE